MNITIRDQKAPDPPLFLMEVCRFRNGVCEESALFSEGCDGMTKVSFHRDYSFKRNGFSHKRNEEDFKNIVIPVMNAKS